MLRTPQHKYSPAPVIDLADRRWPAARLTRAPIWLSTDLRDGNQALFEPMDIERKLRFFNLLCEIGFKEIEVGFPSASEVEFDFLRLLIEGGHIPPDVTIGVLTQAREPLIARTIESLSGARRAIVHVYNATSKRFRETVFGLSRAQVVSMAVGAVRQIRGLTQAQPQTEWLMQYSPETFTATELPFAKQICDAVTLEWDASPQRPVIINLPATVEVDSPNVYADRIEWMHHHLERRDSVVLSVHTHNDRGCAVAAAELAQLAGAQRVEGCLFGNGERTGNVDLVTLALNLYGQGIDPGLDFSRIDAIARTVEYCNQLPIHPRHPYVGDLVYTAFSGSHQDAIRKGFAAQRDDELWQVPYLPIDPKDLGRSYDAVIRINGQSGKGGIAYLLEQDHGLALPRRLQIEFASLVQQHADAAGGEVTAAQLWELFAAEYLATSPYLELLDYRLPPSLEGGSIEARVRLGTETLAVTGTGSGPLEAMVRAFGWPVMVREYSQHALGAGADARAVAFVEAEFEGVDGARFGVAIDSNIVTASLKALCAALNRLLGAATESRRAPLLAGAAARIRYTGREGKQHLADEPRDPPAIAAMSPC